MVVTSRTANGGATESRRVKPLVDALVAVTVAMVVAGGLPTAASAKDLSITVATAQCLAERAPAQMRTWVLADGPMLMWKEGIAARQQTGCTQDIDTRGEYWTFRGALAEALLLQTLSAGMAARWNEAKAPTDLEVALNWKNPTGRRSYLTNVVAECTAQSNVKGSLDLFRSAHGSAAEKATMAVLAPDIAACRARAGNFSDKVDPDMFRARLALAAYEMNDAVYSAASGTGK